MVRHDGPKHPRTLLMVTAAVALFCTALSQAYGEVRNPNGVAVIIGNKAYDHEGVPEVSYAHRDAAAFKRYVIDVLGYDEDNVIEVLDATQAELWTAFGSERSHEGSTLWSYLHPRGSDVVVYYSGHGVPGLNDKRGYLLPRDADPNTAEINGYPIDVLYENLRKLEEARTVTVYLDACFSGGSPEGMLVRSASPVSWSAELPEAAADKLTVLTAASGVQLASWDEEAEHGLFTNHLLDALYGKADEDRDGRVTAGEVDEYLLGTMTRAARRTYKRRQEATLNGLREAVLASAVRGGFPERPEVRTEAEGRDDAAFAEAQAAATAAAYEAYLQAHPQGRRAEDARRLLLAATEREAFERARSAGTVAAYEGYLMSYPQGRHAAEARRLLASARDDEAYERAQAAGTAAAYGAYLKEYPSGNHAPEARQRQRELQAEAEAREDDAAYRRAQASDTAAAYAEYLRRYPTGRHAAEARRRQRELERKRPGEVFRDCDGCPELVVVPAGSYLMGSPSSEEGRFNDEGPQHRVTIGEPFAVGVYEVTRGEYARFVASSRYSAGNSCWTYESGEWKSPEREELAESGVRTDGLAPCGVRELGRRAGIREVADEGDGAGVPADERERVGVRGAGADDDGEVLGRERAGAMPARERSRPAERIGLGAGLRRRTRADGGRWGAIRGTGTDCTTCWATCGSGRKTAGTRAIAERRRTGERGSEASVVVVWCAGAPGSAVRGSSGRPTAAGTTPETATTILVFELPGRSLRESLRPYLGGPGGGSPLVARNLISRSTYRCEYSGRADRGPPEVTRQWKPAQPITRAPRERRWKRTIASWRGWCRRWSGFRARRSSCSATESRPSPLDVLEALIEATYTRQRASHLARANLGVEKLRFLLRLACDLRHLDRRRYEHAARCLDETGRRIGAWNKAHRARQGS